MRVIVEEMVSNGWGYYTRAGRAGAPPFSATPPRLTVGGGGRGAYPTYIPPARAPAPRPLPLGGTPPGPASTRQPVISLSNREKPLYINDFSVPQYARAAHTYIIVCAYLNASAPPTPCIFNVIVAPSPAFSGESVYPPFLNCLSWNIAAVLDLGSRSSISSSRCSRNCCSLFSGME